MGNIFRNIKTGKNYKVLLEKEYIKNSTNIANDQHMVLYSDGENYFVREYKEFYQKFEKIKI